MAVKKKQPAHSSKVQAQLDKIKKDGLPPKSQKAVDKEKGQRYIDKARGKTTAPNDDSKIDFDIGALSDAENEAPPTSDKLERAIKMGELMRQQQLEVERIQGLLSDATKAYNKTAMEELPTLLRELKLQEITLVDGSKIAVKKEYNAAITDERRDEALQWLRDHNFAGIIKTAVTAEFGAGKDKQALALAKKLQKEFDEVTLKAGVHSATLKSFVKEQLEAGVKKFPLKLFGVHEYFVAKLTQPKGK